MTRNEAIQKVGGDPFGLEFINNCERLGLIKYEEETIDFKCVKGQKVNILIKHKFENKEYYERIEGFIQDLRVVNV